MMDSLQEKNRALRALEHIESGIEINKKRFLENNKDFDPSEKDLSQQQLFRLVSYYLYVYRNDLDSEIFVTGISSGNRGQKHPFNFAKNIKFEENYDMVISDVKKYDRRYDNDKSSIFFFDIDENKCFNRMISHVSKSPKILRKIWLDKVNKTHSNCLLSQEQYITSLKSNFISFDNHRHDNESEYVKELRESFIYYRKLDMSELQSDKDLKIHVFELRLEGSNHESYKKELQEIK